MSKTDLIPLKQNVLEEKGIPFAAQTLYAWHSRGKNSKIFVKIGGKLFLHEKNFWDIAIRGEKR